MTACIKVWFLCFVHSSETASQSNIWLQSTDSEVRTTCKPCNQFLFILHLMCYNQLVHFHVLFMSLLCMSFLLLFCFHSRELTFKKGETVYITRQIDNNWYEGEYRGHVGIFPISYVEVCTYKDTIYLYILVIIILINIYDYISPLISLFTENPSFRETSASETSSSSSKQRNWRSNCPLQL